VPLQRDMRMVALALIASALAGPAMGQTLRELCSDRPGLGTQPCTVDAGHLQVELGIAAWERHRQPDSSERRIEAGELLLRAGLDERTEVRLGWLGYGHVRERDQATGAVEHMVGVGDVTIGLKRNLRNPDGSGLSIALLPFATVPVGRDGVGAGTWETGLLAPASYALSEAVSLQLTPEVDAAANEDGHGRHLAYGGTVGLQAAIAEAVTIAVEVQDIHDRQPDDHHDEALLGLSLAYQPAQRLQFDVGANAGLNHASPDLRLYAGVPASSRPSPAAGGVRRRCASSPSAACRKPAPRFGGPARG
jgi:hypothetical protein